MNKEYSLSLVDIYTYMLFSLNSVMKFSFELNFLIHDRNIAWFP